MRNSVAKAMHVTSAKTVLGIKKQQIISVGAKGGNANKLHMKTYKKTTK